MTPEEVETIVRQFMRHGDPQFKDEVNHLIRAANIPRDQKVAELAAQVAAGGARYSDAKAVKAVRDKLS